jgi:hypothetical protein
LSPNLEQVQVNDDVGVPDNGPPLNGPEVTNAALVQVVVAPEQVTTVAPTLLQEEQVPLAVQDVTVEVDPELKPTALQTVCELDSKPVFPTLLQELQVPEVWLDE